MKFIYYSILPVLLVSACTDAGSDKPATDTVAVTPKDTTSTSVPSSPETTTTTEISAEELNATEHTADLSKLDQWTAYKLTYGSTFANEKDELLYKAKSEQSESYDGYYHITPDTIYQFTNDAKEEYAIAVFKSLDYTAKDEKDMSCHGCGSSIGLGLLKKENNVWVAKNTKPIIAEFGSWGQAPDMNVKVIGGKSFLILSDGFTGQGYTESFDKILWVDEKFPFTEDRFVQIDAHMDNYGAVGDDSPESYSWDAQYEWKDDNGKVILNVTYTGTESDDGKIKKKKGSKRYTLNEKTGKLE